jgi:hypothetical protein
LAPVEAAGCFADRSNLEGTCGRALWLDTHCKKPLPYHLISLYRLARSVGAFDIIHFRTDYLHFPLFASHWRKTPTKLHGRLDLECTTRTDALGELLLYGPLRASEGSLSPAAMAAISPSSDASVPKNAWIGPLKLLTGSDCN